MAVHTEGDINRIRPIDRKILGMEYLQQLNQLILCTETGIEVLTQQNCVLFLFRLSKSTEESMFKILLVVIKVLCLKLLSWTLKNLQSFQLEIHQGKSEVRQNFKE